MGIYISGVKGLPEQVQENKNKIKEVEEQIEGIDFEAVRQLQGQVAENTQDINNLEASIGVQNQAINTLNNDVDALESKTQLISYNDDLSKTDFRNSIEVADDVITRGLHVSGDGTIANANGSGLHFQEGPNDDTLTIANKDGAVSHYLQLHADGTLTLDDNPVGAKTLYQHYITLSDGSNYCPFGYIINTKQDAYGTSTFMNWLVSHGFTAENTPYRMRNLYFKGSDICSLTYVWTTGGSIRLKAFNTVAGAYQTITIGTVEDIVLNTSVL